VGDAIGPATVINLPPLRRPFSRRPVLEVQERIGGNRPQVVHCLSADLARRVQHWAAQWKALLVVHLSDLVDVARFGRLSRDDRTMVIATTATLEKAFLEKYPHMHERLCMVPFGIPAKDEAVCLSRPDRVPSAVVTAPLTRDCGLDQVLRSLHGIVHDGREVQLFILSTGPAERQFRRLAEQLDIRSHVTFVGPLSDWSRLSETMSGADFYILPGSRRRFTISTLLAMAGGLAILAPKGTIGDYLIDTRTAMLFDPQNPEELTARWSELLLDQESARQLAARALAHLREHHQASRMVMKIADFYRRSRRALAENQKLELASATAGD
jgi:glycosyltransferase involved in cell wall biosynthesis